MARIWTSEASVPAVAVTLATGESNNQPILFTTQYGQTGDYTPANSETGPKSIKLEWVIKSVNVTLMRDWDVSQASIVVACNTPNADDELPTLPDVSAFRGGNYPYLWCEDEIRIYAGYLNSSSTPIGANLLDEVPFDFEAIDGKHQYDRNKPLVPIFWGFIDKIEFSGSSSGLQMIISCRDRVRVFSDTKILSIPAFQGNTKSQGSEAGPNGEGKSSAFNKGDRAAILMQLAQGASGSTLGDSGGCSCWRSIEEGPYTVRYAENNSDREGIEAIAFESPTKWTRSAALTPMNEKANPRFHIWTERPPIVKGEANAVLQVFNKFPLEVVDALAKSEERPMDFYASHVNGDYVFGPRSLDISGFEDETRVYRTYFFKKWPKELGSAPPSPNQMIISMRSATSTMSTFNKFVVVDSKNNGSSSFLLENVEQGFYAVPWQLQGRTPGVPCRTQVIYDGALASYDNPDQGALLVGLSAARIWSRDVNGVQLELLGDPTWFPGEAVRVYNSVLHDSNIFTITDPDNSESHHYVIKNEVEAKVNEAKSQSAALKAQACSETVASEIADRMLNQNPARILTSGGDLVLPTYKVRTIQHKILASGKRGWTTVINAVSDY